MLLRTMLDRPDLAEQVERIEVHGNHMASTYSNFIFREDKHLLAKPVDALSMPRAGFFDTASSRNRSSDGIITLLLGQCMRLNQLVISADLVIEDSSFWRATKAAWRRADSTATPGNLFSRTSTNTCHYGS
jgi:hypothetical protein